MQSTSSLNADPANRRPARTVLVASFIVCLHHLAVGDHLCHEGPIPRRWGDWGGTRPSILCVLLGKQPAKLLLPLFLLVLFQGLCLIGCWGLGACVQVMPHLHAVGAHPALQELGRPCG